MTDGFCIQCGHACSLAVPDGDNRQRRICSQCSHIHYENPKNVVGCLLEWEGKVLLCKRAIEPRYGYWTLPAGFMEQNESTVQGAAREAFEEASAECDDLRLFSVYNLPRISQVYIMFVGKLRNGYARASEETLEVGLFDHSEIPWSELAFPVVTESLTRFYDEIEAAAPRVHCADIHSLPGQKLEIVRYP